MLLTIEELKARQIKILEENVEFVETLLQKTINTINETINRAFVIENKDSFVYYICTNDFKVCGSEIVFEAFALRVANILKDSGYNITLTNSYSGYDLLIKNPLYMAAELVVKNNS